MYPKSIRTTTFHIHRGGRGEDGAHYIGGGWGGGMATLDHIYPPTGAGKEHVPEEHGCHFPYLLHLLG